MAGAPMRRRVLAALTTRAGRELGDGASILDYACHFVADGGRIGQLASLIATDIGEPVSRPFVSGILNNITDDAKDRIAAARRESALVLVEEAAQIADDTEPTTGAVQKARLQVGMRQWIAERFAPEQFGSKPAVSVDFGAMMYEALLQPPPPRPPELGSPPHSSTQHDLGEGRCLGEGRSSAEDKEALD